MTHRTDAERAPGEPTCVFVRLPFSGTERDRILKEAEVDPDRVEEAILAIGTPVTSKELEVVGYACSADLPLEREDSFPAYCASIFSGPEHNHREPLVRECDAISNIAEEQRISNLRAEAVDRWTNLCAQRDEIIDGLQDEIDRLTEYYKASEEIYEIGLINASPEMFRRQERARAALKGPEA